MTLNATDPAAAPLLPADQEHRRRWVLDPKSAFTLTSLTSRLLGARWRWLDTPMSLRLWFWLAPTLAAVVGGILRFVRLSDPHALVFDETYYVKDAYSLLQSGYERNWADHANDHFVVGDFSFLQSTPEYVVHPPVGKWMIAFGMWLFGPSSSFGWRFSAAAIGTLSVFLLALIAQKMFRSTILGAVAGLLFAVDGHAIVMSRTSVLDIFVMFWALAAFGALLMDRDDGRRRLAKRLGAAVAASGGAGSGGAGAGGAGAGGAGAGGMRASVAAGQRGWPPATLMAYGPWLGWRPWRLMAAICLGLCTGTKWSGLFFLAAFGLLTVFWDLNARRIAGIRYWIAGGLLKDGLLAFAYMVPVAALTYLATWTGWFLASDSYDRNWAKSNPAGPWGWVPDSLRSLWHYHLTAYNFHTGLSSDHPYKANAWSWLVMGRPTSFYTDYPKHGEKGCAADSCAAVVTSLGNPVIWWSAALAAVFLIVFWAARRDWRAGAILAGLAAGYLPWLLYPNRTIFFFYAIAYEPYLLLALVFVLGLILGNASHPSWRRKQGALLVGIFLVLTLLVSAYFYPIWTAEQISYQDWKNHMWMPSWI